MIKQFDDGFLHQAPTETVAPEPPRREFDAPAPALSSEHQNLLDRIGKQDVSPGAPARAA